MDNYKIKVKDEAESEEAQELFVQLGYELFKSSRLGMVATEDNGTVYPDVIENWDAYEGKEITLPQLRDLVVLKRNDVKDANFLLREDHYYKSSRGDWYFYGLNGWKHSTLTDIEGIEPICPTQDPALISGADVPALIKNGESVQFRSAFNVQGGGDWQDLNLERDEEEFSLGDLINARFEWRLKPQTIKFELELPKPFEPKDGDECFIFDSEQEDGFYRFTYGENSGFHKNLIQFGAYRTEAEVKQVVEQLRKIRGAS